MRWAEPARLRTTLVVAFIAISGCSESVESVPSCPDGEQQEHAAAVRAVEYLEAVRGRTRLDVTEACAAMTADLTPAEPAIERPLAHEAAAAICADALAHIEEHLDEDVELAAELTRFGGCDRHRPAEEACLLACGPSESCALACDATAVFRAGCLLPVLEASSDDVALAATISEHFPVILALDLYIANFNGEGMDSLEVVLPALGESLAREPGCEHLSPTAAELDARAALAFGELIDLVSWVRVTRMSIAE